MGKVIKGIKTASQKMLATFGNLGNLWRPLAELSISKYIIYIKYAKDRHESMTRGKLAQNTVRPPNLNHGLNEITVFQARPSTPSMLRGKGVRHWIISPVIMPHFLGENRLDNTLRCLIRDDLLNLENANKCHLIG